MDENAQGIYYDESLHATDAELTGSSKIFMDQKTQVIFYLALFRRIWPMHNSENEYLQEGLKGLFTG